MPYVAHPSASVLPPPETKMWRFMSFEKFADMLLSSSLYFSQAQILRNIDPFEGALPDLNLASYRQLSEDPDLLRTLLGINSDDILEAYRQLFAFDAVVERRRIWRYITYINCWHMSDHESALLWSAYAKNGVAVESSVLSIRREH